MADSRLTFAQTLALLDNIAKQHQLLKAVADGGFTGEGTNTLLYAQRYMVETRMRAWTSDSAIRDIVPNAVNSLNPLDVTDSSGTTRLLLPQVEGILHRITSHHANYDTTYSSFWEWFAANVAAATDDKVLGEVAELMVAAGLAVDPDHCVPPENLKLGYIAFTDVETATLTSINAINTLLYAPSTIELYCVARNVSPNEIVMAITDAKIPSDGVTDTGSTAFDVTVANTLAAGQVMDITGTIAATDIITSLADAGLTITSGGKNGDQFYVRVKQYRAAAV